MKKKLLSMVLSFCFVAGAFSGVPVFAADTETLQSLINRAENGDTIVLYEDYRETVTIGGEKNLILDLNGHTLSGVSDRTLVNNGTITITDSADGGSIAAERTDAVDCYAVVNNGTMTIQDADIVCTTTGDGFAQGINNTGVLTVDGGDISAVTTGPKWAIALFNTGTVKSLDGNLTGEIQNAATSNVNALAVSNEANAVIEEISGGKLTGRLDNDGIAFGIRNRGEIRKISEGEIYAVTTGIKYAYGLHNEASGRIGEISGGHIIGEIDRESNGNNALGIRNNGTIENITGGEFKGKILGGGSAYGIRNDEGEIQRVSGGMYRGNNASNGIYIQGGTLTYANGFGMLADSDHVGYRYVGRRGTVYTEILDEYENHVATYFFDRAGKQSQVLGEEKDSYTIYQKYGTPTAHNRKTAEKTVADFAKTGKSVTWIEHTTEKPVYYFLGSSVTIGLANNAVSFADYMAEENDWICHKRAISGTTLVDNGLKSYVQRLENDVPVNGRIDHLICQLSTNDASQNKPLGSLSDSFEADALDCTTIYGALEYVAYYCKNVLNCELSFYTNPKYTNDLYTKMLSAVYEVAEKWGVGVIDFYNYKDMEPLEDSVLNSYMSDPIHPNGSGYRWMAKVMGNYLKTYQPVFRETEKISLDKETMELFIGESVQLTAVIEPEEAADKTILWTSSASGIVSVDANGNVKAHRAGEAEITAETANGKHAVCHVTVKEKEAEKIVLDKEELELYRGGSAQLTAVIEPEDAEDKAVIWTSAAPEIASVDARGNVIAHRAGEAEITAETANGNQAFCHVTVKEKEAERIVLDKEELELYRGESAQLTAVIEPEDAEDKAVVWTSAAPEIVSVDARGNVIAHKAGEAEITAETANGNQAFCHVTVKEKKAERIVLDKEELELYRGECAQLTTVIEPEDAEDKAVIWTSAAPEIASVDARGNVIAHKAGEAEITAETANGNQAFCHVTVKEKKAERIVLDKEELELYRGECAQLTAVIEPEDAEDKAVIWTSAAPEIASVDARGNVIAHKAGEAEITAETANGNQAFCHVTVKEEEKEKPPLPASEEIKVNVLVVTGSNILTEGDKMVLEAAVSPANATDKALTWVSSDDKIVSVDANGTATAKQAGKAEITVAAKDGSGVKAVVKITVKPQKVKNLTVKVKSGKAIVSFKKAAGVKKYTVSLYKNGKLIKKASAGKKAKVTVNKKLKAGKYSVKVRYTKNGVTSADTVRKFKVNK